MGNKFWKTSWYVILAILQAIWLLIVLTFVVLPRLVINPLRRVSLKNRMKRKMMKEGMPRSIAEKMAQKYKKDLLHKYGSLGGLFRTAKLVRNTEKKENEINSENVSPNTNQTYFYTL